MITKYEGNWQLVIIGWTHLSAVSTIVARLPWFTRISLKINEIISYKAIKEKEFDSMNASKKFSEVENKTTEAKCKISKDLKNFNHHQLEKRLETLSFDFDPFQVRIGNVIRSHLQTC